MWSIKFLSGPEKGKEYLLPSGAVTLGRGRDCQISVQSKGVSKKHAQIIVDENGLFIKDLNSSNGVFLNGCQIHKESLKEGDQVGLYRTIFKIRRKKASSADPAFHYMNYRAAEPSYAFQKTNSSDLEEDGEAAEAGGGVFSMFQKTAAGYMEQVVLPGVYKLAEWMDFRYVVGGFILVFALILTLLSSLPLLTILKDSLEHESKNHAQSISKTLASMNRENFRKGLHTALNVDFALKRPGVKKAYIINAVNGRILAPADSALSFPKEPFIHKARKLERGSVEKISGSLVAAAAPMEFYNPQTGENAAGAYAVVTYDMGALAVGGGKVLSLLLTNLFFAGVLALIVFFFLIHLIHFPIQSINSQLNRSLKDSSSPAVSQNYQSQVLSALCQNINSALNRISQQESRENIEEEEGFERQRTEEMSHVVEMMGFPALSIHLQDNTVAGLNSGFKEQLGMEEILHRPLSAVQDSGLRESLETLISQAKSAPEDISFGEAHLNGMELQTSCLFIRGAKEPAYAIVAFMPHAEAA